MPLFDEGQVDPAGELEVPDCLSGLWGERQERLVGVQTDLGRGVVGLDLVHGDEDVVELSVPGAEAEQVKGPLLSGLVVRLDGLLRLPGR